jgi:hypothetical protein
VVPEVPHRTVESIDNQIEVLADTWPETLAPHK